jgi:hypothetical protein
MSDSGFGTGQSGTLEGIVDAGEFGGRKQAMKGADAAFGNHVAKAVEKTRGGKLNCGVSHLAWKTLRLSRFPTAMTTTPYT